MDGTALRNCNKNPLGHGFALISVDKIRFLKKSKESLSAICNFVEIL